MTRIHALVNQKGGVGKTTTAINLGAYLALAGQRVLLVDLDPQANTTSCLGVEHEVISGGTYEALIGTHRAGDLLLKNPSLQLTLLPSSSALSGAQIELVNVPERESLLRKALASLDGRFDYILIDCPPSLGILTLNALLAARNGVIIPVQCEYLALEGLTQLVSTLQRVRKGLFPELAIRGLVMTMYDGRTNLSQDVVNEVARHFPQQVFRTIIPRNIRLAEAPSHAMPISTYDPASPGARAYQALALELLQADGAVIASQMTKGG